MKPPRLSPDTPMPERLLRYSMAVTNGCRVWIGALTRDGYGQVWVGRKGDGGALRRVHRVAWQEVNGPIPDGMQVLHSCDTPACINVAHLFLGNNADNMADKVRKGRQARGAALSAVLAKGESHHAAKLSMADVLAIRASPAMGKDLAAQYGVSQDCISCVRLRKKWAWL